MNNYYVYMYSHPITKIPFYVGKGKGERLYEHLKDANGTEHAHRLNTIRKIRAEGLEPIVVKVLDNVSESEAYEFEDLMIDMIGRRRLGTGPLTNIQCGSDPAPKVYALREDGSKAMGRDVSGEKNPRYGAVISQAQIDKFLHTISQRPDDWVSKATGQTRSDEIKKQMSEDRKGITFIQRFGEERALEIAKKVSDATKGKAKPDGHGRNVSDGTTDKFTNITDGVSTKRLILGNTVPEGWKIGVAMPQAQIDKAKANRTPQKIFKRVKITNGKVNSAITNLHEIPNGWYIGQIKRNIPDSDRIHKKKAFNNGVVEIKLFASDEIPENFIRGLLKWSK